MASIVEMYEVITSISADSPLADGIEPFHPGGLRHHIREVLLIAEDKGLSYNGVFGVNDEPRTYWLVGDYIISYITADLDFSVVMLTEDMMDGLRIEER